MTAKTTMEDFEALLQESFEIDTPEEGTVVKGRVIAIAGRFASLPEVLPETVTLHFIHGKADPAAVETAGQVRTRQRARLALSVTFAANGVLVGSPSGTSFSDSGLSNGTSYAYTVRATDAAGNLSAASGSATATPFAPVDTSAPTAPTISTW